jgi:hypothetical protein
MSEWQPIETAPRDGTQRLGLTARGYCIFAWHDDTRGPGVSDDVQVPGWEAFCDGETVMDEGWDTGTGYTLEVSPTHWMPLPEPPK